MTATQFFDQLPVLYFKWHFIGSGVNAIIELAIWAYQAYRRPATYLKSYKLKDIILSSLISTWIGVFIYATDLLYYIDKFLYNRYLKNQSNKQDIKIMLQSDRDALHYDVIANTAHKIEKVANELASLYRASYFNTEKAELRKKHLQQYFDELTHYFEK